MEFDKDLLEYTNINGCSGKTKPNTYSLMATDPEYFEDGLFEVLATTAENAA